MTGENKNLGQQLIKSARIALKDIGSNKLELYPKDSGSDANQSLRSASELKDMGIKIIIGPVFYESLTSSKAQYKMQCAFFLNVIVG